MPNIPSRKEVYIERNTLYKKPFLCILLKIATGFVFGGTTKNLFVIAHTFTGTAYMWGKNYGTGSTAPILKPTLMDQLTKKVVEVACGYEHCLFLNIDGEVLAPFT